MGAKRKHRLPERAAPEAKAGVEAAGSPGLLEKYRSLTQRYHDLVVKYETAAYTRIDTIQMAEWALRTSESGLCLVRAGSVALTNPRFTELDRSAGRRRWREDGQGPASQPSLRRLIVTAAERLLGSHLAVARSTYRQVGREMWIEVRLERVSNTHPPSVMGIIHDITPEMRTRRELEQARALMQRRERLRDLGEMAAGIAHDLNNTFNALSLKLEVMARRSRDEKTTSDLATALRIVEDAATRISRVQAFAGGGKERKEEEVELGAVIREAVEMVRPQLEKRGSGLKLELELDGGELPPVRAVPADLRHVFANLLLNARDAMRGRNGRVTIEAHPSEGGSLVTVADEGTGIPAKVLPRIFDPFFTTKGKKGTGLGLSVAFQVMSKIGGRLSAGNRPDGGAVFTLFFPGHKSPRMNGRPPLVAPRSESRHGRILVIDDEPDNLEVMRQLLEMEGHEVELAESADGGLERLRSAGPFDIVLCDVRLPDKSGWELARAVKQLAPSTPVVMLTGWAGPERDPTNGAVGVVHKPVRVDTLRALIAKAVAGADTRES